MKLVYDLRRVLVKGHLEDIDLCFRPFSEMGVDPAVRELVVHHLCWGSVAADEGHWGGACFVSSLRELPSRKEAPDEARGVNVLGDIEYPHTNLSTSGKKEGSAQACSRNGAH